MSVCECVTVTYPPCFEAFGEHNNVWESPFPDHPPEVTDSVWHWTLGCNVASLTLIALQEKTNKCITYTEMIGWGAWGRGCPHPPFGETIPATTSEHKIRDLHLRCLDIMIMDCVRSTTI